MIVTQPPTQTMRVTHHTHSMDGGTGESRALLPDLSLRMGALYDLAVPFVDHADSNFYIRWPRHNGHDLKGDLTLAFCSTAGCMPREEERMLDGRFESEGRTEGRSHLDELVHQDWGWFPRSLLNLRRPQTSPAVLEL
jgi:hypothetical protein